MTECTDVPSGKTLAFRGTTRDMAGELVQMIDYGDDLYYINCKNLYTPDCKEAGAYEVKNNEDENLELEKEKNNYDPYNNQKNTLNKYQNVTRCRKGNGGTYTVDKRVECRGSDEEIRGELVASNGTSDADNYILLKQISERGMEIKKNINNHHYGDGFSALDTCVWGIRDDKGNNKPYLEYIVVMQWCGEHGITYGDIEKRSKEIERRRKEIEEEKNFTVTRNIEVSRKEETTISTPSLSQHSLYAYGKPRTIKETKAFNFNFENANDFNLKKSNLNKNTYILIHGYNSNPEVWAKDMANLIESDAQILLLDWSKIAKEHKILPSIPYYQASWIDMVSDKALETLKKWNIQNNKTTIISHSLGTLLAMELAVKLENTEERDLRDINLVAFDPAYSPTGFDIDFNNKKFNGTKFKGFSKNGACLVADSSWSGSENLMKTCREGYLIDYSGNPDVNIDEEIEDYVEFAINKAIEELKGYLINKSLSLAIFNTTNSEVPILQAIKVMDGDGKEVVFEETLNAACKRVNKKVKLPYLCQFTAYEIAERLVTNHVNVPKVYKTVLSNPFYNNYLSLADTNSRKNSSAPFDKMDLSHFFDSDKQAHGIIYTERDQPKKIKYLKTLKSNNYALYGNTQDNKFECNDDKNCLMYTSIGNDKIIQREYSKNVYITDFDEKNDKITFTDKSFIKRIDPIWMEDEAFLDLGKPSTAVDFYYRDVVFEGYNYDDVYEWVSIADGSLPDSYKVQGFTTEDLPSLKEDNPIQMR